MIATLTDTDLRVRDAVTRQLDWDPSVDASAIGVAAKDGTVTLTGYIGSYAGKLAAERVAKTVRGVRAVANEIEVRLKLPRTDVDIAGDVVRALEMHALVPRSVQAAVHSGHVTLTGAVEWAFQAREAEAAVRHIAGVRHVMNHMTIARRVVERDVRHRIVEALHRNANLDARGITVVVDGDTVVLSGRVGTWLQRQLAEHAAADAPGMMQVNNRIVVDPSPELDNVAPDDVC